MKDKEYVAAFGALSITFYPLSMKDIRSMPSEMKALVGIRKGDDPFAPERFAKLLKLWTASAKRGNPEITEEEVELVVDFRNLLNVNRALLGQDWETELDVPHPAANGAAVAEEVDFPPTSPQTGGDSTRA